MPTYVYECRACGNRFEVVQHATDEPLKSCNLCSGEVRKVFFPSRVIFKGSGWHITDYDNGGRKAAETEASEAKPAETKPDSPAESKPEPRTETPTKK